MWSEVRTWAIGLGNECAREQNHFVLVFFSFCIFFISLRLSHSGCAQIGWKQYIRRQSNVKDYNLCMHERFARESLKAFHVCATCDAYVFIRQNHFHFTQGTHFARNNVISRSWIPSNRISLFFFLSFRPSHAHRLRQFVCVPFMPILVLDGNVGSPNASRYKRNCSAQRKLLRFHVPGASYRIITRNPVSMQTDAENHARWVRIEIVFCFLRNPKKYPSSSPIWHTR